MAYVLVKSPIDLEELAQRTLRTLRKQSGRISKDSVQDYLCEDPEEGEGGVWAEQEECEETINLLIARGVLEEVDEPQSEQRPSRKVLYLKV